MQRGVFDALGGGEVDIVLVGLRVDPGAEVHSVEVPVVPPVPGHLAGLDPAPVAFGRPAQEIDQVVVQQLAVLFGHGHDAPGKGCAGALPGDVVLRGAHDALQFVVAVLLDELGVGGEESAERRPAQVAQIHARIVEQVGLGDVDPPAVVHGEGDGQEGLLVLFPRAQRVDVIVGFEAVEERIARGVGFDIGDGGLHVLGEAEFRLLVADDEIRFGAGDETPGDAAVVGAEHEVEGLVAERQLLVALLYGRTLVDRGGKTAVHGAAHGLLETDRTVPGAAVPQADREDGRGEHGRAAAVEGIADLRSGVHAEVQAPVGRGKVEMARRSRKTEGKQQQGCQFGKESCFHDRFQFA